MKKVMVGSENAVKVAAVRQALSPNFTVSGMATVSGVSDQPFSDQETRDGAVNRAWHAQKNADLGIGLEGGVQPEGKNVYLCSWGGARRWNCCMDGRRSPYTASRTYCCYAP